MKFWVYWGADTAPELSCLSVPGFIEEMAASLAENTDFNIFEMEESWQPS